MSIRLSDKDKKLGHRRIDEGGETTYKKITSNQIMGSIQLGIQYAVGGLASKPERDLLIQDFMTVETKVFTCDGANLTPAHRYPRFSFKIYAPIAFRYFRDVFGIQPEDFMLSFCSAPLRELSNPGASGSIFYVTTDDEFIIKTVTHKEAEFLQKLLPGYYMNIVQNPRTLLPKFFGLYCYYCNSKNIRLVIMNNLFPSWIEIHEKYDLKGSTYKRKASSTEREKSTPTYKDLDFMEFHRNGIILDAEIYNALCKTIERDCRVLESFKIMDYSLLIGIHFVSKSSHVANNDTTVKSLEEPGTSNCHPHQHNMATEVPSTSNKKRHLYHTTVMESIDKQLTNTEVMQNTSGGIPAKSDKGEDVILFIGIIDVLQSYKMMKKIEHTFKSMFFDSDTISVHRPDFYANRFLTFMKQKVFLKNETSE